MILHGMEQVVPGVTSLSRLFEISAICSPSKRAVLDASDGTILSFHQLNTKANQLARYLLDELHKETCANPDGDCVIAVCIAPSATLVLTILAIQKAGAAYLPIDVTFPTSRVQHIIQDARPVLVLGKGDPPALAQLMEGSNDGSVTKIILLDKLEEKLSGRSGDDVDDEDRGVGVTPESIAAVLYTSGSTGTPKGVRIPHRAVLNRLAWQWRTFPYMENEVCCFKTALTFVDSISEIFGPLLTGHTIIVIPKEMTRAVEGFVQVLETEKVGRLVLVPSLLRSILLYCSTVKQPILTNLRLWVCSGEIFPSDLLQSFFQTFTSGQVICNFYGSTEVMGDVTYMTFNNAEEVTNKLINNKVPIGVPVANTKVYLLDGKQREVHKDAVGELYVAGCNVADGYVGGGQQEKYITNSYNKHPNYKWLFKTGDFARVVNGQLVFEGREDGLVKVRGHRVDLSEIEAAMQSVPGVMKCHAICSRRGEVSQALVAYFTSDDEELSPEVLKLRVANLLPPYMEPQIYKLSFIPQLVNGKVDRQALQKEYESRGMNMELLLLQVDVSEVNLDQQDAARDLLHTVYKVLGTAVSSSLTLKHSFYQIGGNSLNSIITITSLRDLGYNICISDFTSAETLQDLLPFMREKQTELQAFSNDEGALQDDGGNLKDEYIIRPIRHSDKEAASHLIAKATAEKMDLSSYLDLKESELLAVVEQLWGVTVGHGMSFVLLRSSNEELLGATINYDIFKEPTFQPVSEATHYLMTFLEEAESPIRDSLPDGPGQLGHSFLIATSDSVSPKENVIIIQAMEIENIRLAKEMNFTSFFATNTSCLTQHICDDILSYTTLANIQVNQYVAPDGSMPFNEAPDSQHVRVSRKTL